jgi:hypothetical protein
MGRVLTAWGRSGRESATHWRQPPLAERVVWLLGLVTGRLASRFADGWRTGICGTSPTDPDPPPAV